MPLPILPAIAKQGRFAMPSLVSLRHSRFLLLVAALAFASAAQATTILYTEVISGYGGPTDESPSGTLGDIAFGGLGGTPQAAVLELFFQSDTADVIPFSLGGVHGFENLTGTASVEVLDTGGNVLVRGTFLASDGIFISVDNTNQGIGFGSQGVLSSDPTFPGQPLYPYSIILNGTSDVGTYDLKDNDIIFSVNAASCVNFPGSCGAPFSLATTAGDLFVNENFGGQFGTFTATLVPEASTWVMMLLGFAGLGFAGYHRAKSGHKTPSAA
jgi:hypothetical protein